MQKILDVCCGGKMFYYDKNDDRVLFVDKYPRKIDFSKYDRKDFVCDPDTVADFTNLPFADKTFHVVVFDPPHLVRAGETSWVKAKYGSLNIANWREEIKSGFDECMRVLKEYGVLIFKWSDNQIPFSEIRKLVGNPVFGDKRGNTRWSCYMKVEECDE